MSIRNDFDVEVSKHGPGYNLPQKLGRALWLPMLLMALMAYPAGVVLAAIRSNLIANGGSEATIAGLGHLVPAANFLGFASVLAAISFAIARILGEFRVGGGRVQESVTDKVQTLKLPATAKVFIGVMAMSMMVLLGSVVLHAIIASSILQGSAGSLSSSEQWGIWLEGVRRIGIALYLISIAFGLATIITVLRFQSVRIRELALEKTA